MKFRSTYILFGLIALVLGFLVYKIVSGKKAAESDWVFPGIHPTKDAQLRDDDVKDVTVRIDQDGKTAAVFQCKDGTWSMLEPHKLRVSGPRIKSFVLGILNAKKEKADTAGVTGVGLDEPKTVVTVTRDGDTFKLNLGKPTKSKTDREIYVSTDSQPKEILRIKYNIVEDAFGSMNRFRDNDLLGVHTGNCNYVSVEPGPSARTTRHAAQVLLGYLAPGEAIGWPAVAVGLATTDQAVPKETKMESLAVGADDREKNKWSYRNPDDFGRAEWERAMSSMAPPPPIGKDIENVYQFVQDVEKIRVGDVDRDFIAEGVSKEDLDAKYGLKAGSPETLAITVKRKKEAKETKGSAPFSRDSKKSASSDSGSGSEKEEYEELTLLIGKMATQPPRPTKPEDEDDKKKSSSSEAERAPEPGYYAALSTEPENVVWISGEKVAPLVELTAHRNVLRDRNLVGIERDKIDALHIKLADGSEWDLLRAGKDKHWQFKRVGDPRKKAEDDTVRKLFDAIFEQRIVNNFPEAKDVKDAGLEKPVAEISLWEDGVTNLDEKGSGSGTGSASAGSGSSASSSSSSSSDSSASSSSASSSGSGTSSSGSASSSGSGSPKEEDITKLNLDIKSPEKPNVKLSFGTVKDGNLYIRRTEFGEKERVNVVTVPAPSTTTALVERPKEGPLAYLDRSIPSFYTFDLKDPIENKVTKLTMTHGADVFELTKQKDGDKTSWKITAPKELNSRTIENFAVTATLQDLNNPRIGKIYREKLEELKSYDLDPPMFKVVLTLTGKDSKPEDVTYGFGSAAPDKDTVFFTTSKRDGVFSVHNKVTQFLQEIFYQVATLDVNKVKSIKMTGWKKGSGTSTIEAERTGINLYELKSSGTSLDGEKLDRFLLTNFARLTTKKVLVSGGPKPDDKMFKPAEGALEIEVTFKDDTKPLKLTIGTPYDKGGVKGFHAICSAMPDLVFVVGDEPWKAVVEGANYFAK